MYEFDSEKKMLRLSDRFFVVNLHHFSKDVEGICANIPQMPGIYAWYRSIPTLEQVDLEVVLEQLKFSDGPLIEPRSPSRIFGTYDEFRLTVSSRTFDEFSTSDMLKENLEENIGRQSFDDSMIELFKHSLFFQRPLYIGASKNLKNRIKQHLTGKNSELKDNLETGRSVTTKEEPENYRMQDIFQLSLLFITTGAIEDEVVSEEDEDSEGKAPEMVIEEIAQRLYRPPYVRRIG